MSHSLRRAFALSLLASTAFAARGFAQWTTPTPEELSMTAQAEVPGAPAVFLFREEITDDALHVWVKYARIKVLTESGKEHANVELQQYSSEENGGYTVGDIQGRTIHPDGTVIPFTGKPMVKLVEKARGFKVQAKVFTLPDVEVGSILEYRYTLRYDDNRFLAPSWFIQSDLFTRKAHYLWQPTDKPLITKNERGEQLTSRIAWTPLLPPGAEVTQTQAPSTSLANGRLKLELNVHDIPPRPEEEYMPPIGSLSYRVLFYYSPYSTVAEYWKNEGKAWAKMQDRFIGPGTKVKAAAAQILTPAETTDEARLRKLYAAVMDLENTAFTRSRSASEEHSQGLSPARSTDDVWERKRGSDDQIADLFIALARAAGYKAHAMLLSNRDTGFFLPNYLSFSQLQDVIAVVEVGGKDLYFDPGQRFCPYGHLVWKHSLTQGIRQSDSGAAIADTPAEPYTASKIQRTANLTLNDHGEATGTVKLTYTGAPAVEWRQKSLRGDDTSLRRELRTTAEELLPHGMDVQVGAISNLTEYENPLVVAFEVKGAIGSGTGKRLLLPADIFESNARITFPHEKRELAVYFPYPYILQDASRITFPAAFAMESVPAAESVPFQKFAAYQFRTESTPTSITVRRDFELGNVLFTSAEYPALRAFYTRMETKNQEPFVLKVAAPAAGAGN
ncbi:MAG: DUF3857 and transglutaminase domain-containing protein [Acidobacteriota bacterium]|nr:DUF3857 and transglutaminase domain-containing protein [Acidobacteriota bacterium]